MANSDLLERAWEGVGNFLGGLMHGFERGVTAVFGTSNARYIRRLQAKVEAINALEPRYQAMSDAELREQTFKFRERLKAGQTLDDLLIEAFAVASPSRNSTRRHQTGEPASAPALRGHQARNHEPRHSAQARTPHHLNRSLALPM